MRKESEIVASIVDTMNFWLGKNSHRMSWVYENVEAHLLFLLKKHLKGYYHHSLINDLKGKNVWLDYTDDHRLKVVKFTNIWGYASRDEMIKEINDLFKQSLPVNFTMEKYELPRVVHNEKWRWRAHWGSSTYRIPQVDPPIYKPIVRDIVTERNKLELGIDERLRTSLDKLKEYTFK